MSERKNIKRNKIRPTVDKAGLKQTMMHRKYESQVGLSEYDKFLVSRGLY